MNILEAFKALEQGKKITRKNWGRKEYLYLDENGYIRNEKGNFYTPTGGINVTTKDNWEVSEYISDTDLEFRGKLLAIYLFCKSTGVDCNACPLDGELCNDAKSFNCWSNFYWYLLPKNRKLINKAYSEVIKQGKEDE